MKPGDPNEVGLFDDEGFVMAEREDLVALTEPASTGEVSAQHPDDGWLGVPPPPPPDGQPEGGPRAPAAASTVSPPDTDERPGDGDVGMRPKAAALTDEALLRPTAEPPPRGWRRAVYRLSGGTVNLGPDRAVCEQRDLRARVRAPIGRGAMRVAVLSRKGGVGKTTTALLLGHTFAAERGDRVVALDGNPDAGNLVSRIDREHGATVSDLLADRDRVERYADIRAFTSQAHSRLEAVAADDDPTVVEGLGADDYRDTLELLGRHYNLMVVDTGTGVLAPATQGVLELADLVVVAAPTAVDRARVSYSTLDWLRTNGYGHLADDAVVAITEVRGVDERVDPDAVEALFAAGAAATVRIPWDPHLESGARTQLDDLAEPTRVAYLRLAAAVADRFASAAARQPPLERTGGRRDGRRSESRKQLYAEAKRLGVQGRTRMNKQELADAIDRQQSRHGREEQR